jgi:hypothetical protein
MDVHGLECPGDNSFKREPRTDATPSTSILGLLFVYTISAVAMEAHFFTPLPVAQKKEKNENKIKPNPKKKQACK